MRFLLPLILLSGSFCLPGQVIFDPTGNTMTRYLELTAQQTVAVTRLRTANLQLKAEKFQRTAMVNRELQVEMAKTPLDPMAIGLRHVELATIQKEIMDADTKLKADLRALLTPTQIEKLKPLEEALRLQSLANSAVCEGFIDPPPVGTTVPIDLDPVITALLPSGRRTCFSGNIIPVARY